MRRALLLVLLCGCDAVFGLDAAELPECFDEVDQFGGREPQLIREVDAFSIPRDRDRAVAAIRGITVEASVEDDDDPTPLDIQPMYSMLSIAVEPNREYFMFTASVEPPTLMLAFQEDGKWKFDPRVPKGTFAGTPSNHLNGTKARVVVRLLPDRQLFQEYERDDDGNWLPFGERFELDAYAGANMTEDGRVIVFEGFDKDGNPGVYVAQRGSIGDTFGDPHRVLAGAHRQPQLFGNCKTLYTVDDGQLARYTR